MIETILEKLSGMKILTGEDIGADFTHDEYPGESYIPEAVVEATSTEEVAAVLKLCSESGVAVTVRGAGTGQVGGSVPVKGGIVLSVKGMNRILAYDEGAKTIRVQPGVLLQEVKAEAEKHGMYYPPDPGEQTASIGGNAATNASGPCAVKYGTTRDYVADAVVVLADGTVETLNEKTSAVLGGEGAFGVITELTLKLVEKPGADAILLFPFMDCKTAINAAKAILAADFAPAVVEYLDTDLVAFSGDVTGNPVFPVEMDGEHVAATLMVTFEGSDEDAVMEKMEAVAEMAEDLECLDILVGDTINMKRDFWTAHEAFHTSVESGAKCAFEFNVNIPTDAIAEMVDFAKALGREQGLKVMVLSHVGSGGVHIYAVSDCAKDQFRTVISEFADEIYAKVDALGGDARGEYGYGYAKTRYHKNTESFKALKAALDPKGILNPGKVAQSC